MLIKRLVTSIILIPLFLVALFLLPDTYWALLTLAITAIGLKEWAVLSRFSPRGQIAYVMFPVLILAYLLLTDTPWSAVLLSQLLFYGILLGTLFWFLIAPLWLITRYQINHQPMLAVTGLLVLIPTWISLLVLKSAAYLAHVELQQAQAWLLLTVVVAVWIADSAAYFVGKRWGRRKLAPQISPGKTWEGVAGAWLAISLYGLGVGSFLGLERSLLGWLLFALWGVLALSIIGDLFESLIKRHAGAKDSGSILPGHGGLLDRIDGLTASLPLVAFFVYFPVYQYAWLTM